MKCMTGKAFTCHETVQYLQGTVLRYKVMNIYGAGLGGRGVGEVRPNPLESCLGPRKKIFFYAVLYSLFQKYFFQVLLDRINTLISLKLIKQSW